MPAPTFSHRFIRATLIGMAYAIATALSVLLTRFDNGVAHLWFSTALLLAELSITPRRYWWPTLLACGIASGAVTTWFGFGWEAALPLAFVNLADAVIGALLVERLLSRVKYLESIASVAIFALAAGAAGPSLSGFLGAAIASAHNAAGYWENWRAWVTAHALGTITFAPIAALVLRGELDRWFLRATPRLKAEAAVLMLAMIATCWLVFAQSRAPLLFVPMLPLTVITFRLGRPGAAASVVILAFVGGILTARGFGPINLAPGSLAERSEFFQLYLATTMLIVLPVAAELKHRKLIFRRLQESEARYKLITETATDMLLTFDVDGTIRYASPSSREIVGYDPEDLIGRKGREFIDPRDMEIVLAAHREALDRVGVSHSVVYRAPTADGDTRWFEARARGIASEAGRPVGVECAIRDISDRKQLELRLSHAASTDPLTGLGNRRLFDRRLDAAIAAAPPEGTGGCVAIFDLDHFKRINDRHGHEIGDRVLKAFADEALRIMPPDHLVARLGGEEFGVVLFGIGPQRAAELCNRLRKATAAIQVETMDDDATVTVSVGIADFAPGSARAEVMRAADHALYSAKAAGRDRLRIAA